MRTNFRIRSIEGPEFDCHVATPEASEKVPAVVLASAIFGVNEDLRGIADEFALRGCIAAAPDLFWRTLPGPLAHGDPRASPRGQPRLETIRTGERDLADVLAAYGAVPSRMANVEVHLFPGGQHGYMMRGNAKAFDKTMYDFSMERALAIVAGLRQGRNPPEVR